MNHFSETSKARLQTVHRDLQILATHVLQQVDCTVVCGHRDEAGQDKAFAEKRSQLKWPKSMHNYYPSLAIDLAPFEKSGIDWGKLQSAYFAGRVMGIADHLFEMRVISHRIRPGIDWNNDNDIDDTRFWDGPHFEIIPNEGEKFGYIKY
jgi:peptidoglycan L-alanyl-D-glutamate endopeptidase CwlK